MFFVQKSNFFLFEFFGIIKSEKMFFDIMDRKEWFLDLKDSVLRSGKK